MKKQLRKEVLKRDDYTCQNCGAKADVLDIHHIIPIKYSGTDNINNLIALCKSCHKTIEPRTSRYQDTTRILIDLDDETLAKAQKLADDENRSRKQFIERLVTSWLENCFEVLNKDEEK